VKSSWSKEVKNLDARISDVLGKLRDREMSLDRCSGNDAVKIQLHEAQLKINQLTAEIKRLQQANLQESFGDDLAKVLMSKEEVITQLEKQLKEKDKQIQSVTDQLNQELAAVSCYQTVLEDEKTKSKILATDLKSHTDQHNSYNQQISELEENLAKSNANCAQLQARLQQALLDNETLTQNSKQVTEYNRNELDTLQEEVKTLEYKLVHSQRQAHEYQAILEELDMANSNACGFIQQLGSNSGSCTGQLLVDDVSGGGKESSIQSRLKKNQMQVQLQAQQVILKKVAECEEMRELLKQVQQELDEIRDENVELNDHIYSIDVFMREKDQQCDQYQKEKEEISEELRNKMEEIKRLNVYRQTETIKVYYIKSFNLLGLNIFNIEFLLGSNQS